MGIMYEVSKAKWMGRCDQCIYFTEVDALTNCGKRKDCLSSDRAREIQQPRQDRQEDSEPNCIQGSLGPGMYLAKESTVWETIIA